jgi:hypothetical protein
MLEQDAISLVARVKIQLQENQRNKILSSKVAKCLFSLYRDELENNEHNYKPRRQL